MYLMYLDESGNSRLNNPCIRDQSKFFVLGGVIVKEEHHQGINEQFREFKREVLPPEVAETPLHAVELNNLGRCRKKTYEGVLSQEEGKEVLKQAYRFLAERDVEAIAVIIDTHNLEKKYSRPANPYLLSYQFIIEKFQKIVHKRAEPHNSIGMVNLSKSSQKLATNICNVHSTIMERGTDYVDDFSNIVPQVNIEPTTKSSFYELADLVCYAFQRSYYAWLCENLKLPVERSEYLKMIKPVSTLTIGKIRIEGVYAKVFPYPRFLEDK
jgi:hypothetical protein